MHTHEKIRKTIRRTINDPKIAEKMTPKYPLGCKRMTPSDSYLQTFNLSHVSLQTGGIRCGLLFYFTDDNCFSEN